MNDIALKAQNNRTAELSAQDVENTLKAIRAHRTKPLQQPVAQLAAT